MSVSFINEKPILTGRLNYIDDELATLTGNLGDVVGLNSNEYRILKLMNGFYSFKEIASSVNISTDEVISIYNKFRGERKLSTLAEWNQVGWCENCQVHVAGSICSLCNGNVKKIVFAPPCDPFICFDEERKFIVSILSSKFGIDLPEDTFFLANNGSKNNTFFWEVEYRGSIILKIDFISVDEQTWEYKLMADSSSITKGKNILLNKETVKKTIEANKSRQKTLFDTSTAFIKESINFFNTKPLIYFSGGKESMVMLSLFERLKIKANIITVTTGVDFPDDVGFTMDFKKKIDANPNFKYYLYEGYGQSILDTLNEKKVLSAKDPWCRVDFKRDLKNKGTNDIYKGNDFVACEGSRWYENDFRRRHTKVNLIKNYQHQVWIHPIAEWTALDVWLYIYEQEIPVNPIYAKGFQRTTCWLCPIVNPFHLQCSKKYYPELWDKIKDCKLEAFGDDKTSDLPY